MHYAATYNCPLIPTLILKSRSRRTHAARSEMDETQTACKQVLDEITDQICADFKEGQLGSKVPTVNFECKHQVLTAGP